MDAERIRYTRSGEEHIAWRAFGAGEVDVLWILPTLGSIEMLDHGPAARLGERIRDFARMICFDRRGLGLSDPIEIPATLEEQVADVTAVLEAANAKRVALVSEAEGSMMATMFAATNPDRVSHLVMLHPTARLTWAPGYEWARDKETRKTEFLQPLYQTWATGEVLETLAPVLAAKDPQAVDWFGRWQRISASPGVMLRTAEMAADLDVREILDQVQAPTLVLNRPDSTGLDDRHAEYVASRIPKAELRQIGGRDSISIGEGFEEFTDAIEEFVLERSAAKKSERALATVLFTDIVGSTERAAELGDARWRELLERHDSITRNAVAWYGGRAVKSTGDGFLATFEGPARAVRCALELTTQLRRQSIPIRAGVHTGEIELMGDDVGGMAVHIGARIGDLGDAGEVVVSRTVRDLVVGSGLDFRDRGSVELKGVPGEWDLAVALGG